jgi:uncharacterized membrane protein
MESFIGALFGLVCVAAAIMYILRPNRPPRMTREEYEEYKRQNGLK